MLVALISMIPLTNLLINIPFFASVSQPVPNRYVPSNKSWTISAITNNLIAGLTYPFLLGIGGYFLAQAVPALAMVIADGVSVWFLGNAIIYLIIFAFWYRSKHKKEGVTMYDMGISYDEQKTKIDWGILGKTVLLGAIVLGWLYALVTISQSLLGIEFRIIWPFMREFSAERFGYFWMYLIPCLLFFLLNGGIFLFGQAHQKQYETPAKTQLIWWLKNCLAGITGLLVIWLFQYLPYFFGGPPGFEAVPGLALFGNMIPLLLFVYIPEFILLFFFLTWFYRRTGKVYLGALVISSLAIWWLTAGTAL